MTAHPWDTHYNRECSKLLYPDENLCRLIKKIPVPGRRSAAMDLGCGSGRHINLIKDLGYSSVLAGDISFNALSIARGFNPTQLIQFSNDKIPLKNDSIDLVVAWGSLHYATKDELAIMLDEIRRVLSPGSSLVATLRSTRDTYLKSGRHLGNNVWITDLKEISGSIVSFYDEDELKRFFNPFSSSLFGYMERSLMGQTDKIISHWMISAIK